MKNAAADMIARAANTENTIATITPAPIPVPFDLLTVVIVIISLS